MSDQPNQVTTSNGFSVDSFANQLNVRSDPVNQDYLNDEDSGLGYSLQGNDSATDGDNHTIEATTTEIGIQPTPLRGKTPGETRTNYIRLVCSECSRVIHGNLDSLYKHKQEEHGLKSYACLQRGCNARFDQRGQMSPHCQKEHKDVREFCCKLCDKKYSDYGGLYQHNRNIHLVGLFKCNVDYCGFTTQTHSKMESHITTHDKTFICPICKTGFITKEKLKDHEPLHANESNQSTQTQP